MLPNGLGFEETNVVLILPFFFLLFRAAPISFVSRSFILLALLLRGLEYVLLAPIGYERFFGHYDCFEISPLSAMIVR